METKSQSAGEGGVPQLPFDTFLGVADAMARGPVVPRRLDRAMLNTKSGTEQNRIFSALRWLGWITGSENMVQPEFVEFISRPEKRQEIMATIVRERYGWAVALPENATQADLISAFTEHAAVNGESRRKAITWFLRAAQFADVKVALLFRQGPGRPRGGSMGRAPAKRTRRGAVKREVATEGTEAPPPPPIATVPSSEQEMRFSYFALLHAAAQDGTGATINEKVLDRIERLLNREPLPDTSQPTPKTARQRRDKSTASAPMEPASDSREHGRSAEDSEDGVAGGGEE
jgi:hypothetical protein